MTGHQVLDGQRRYAPSGVIHGFDAVTGQLRWAWDMTHPERTGLPPEGETYTRGSPNMWTTATGDEHRAGLSADGKLGGRLLELLTPAREIEHSSALVALNADRREAWRFQTVHVDVWDYDLGSQVTLIDFPPRPASFLLWSCRASRANLHSRPAHRRAAHWRRGTARAARRRRTVDARATQTYPASHSLRPPDSERDMWGMSLIDQMICRIQFRQASYQGIYTPPTRPRIGSNIRATMAARIGAASRSIRGAAF